MYSQNKIEVNQSSLLSLKAELLRKKQEVHDAKLSDCPNRPTPVIKLKTQLDKVNEGIEQRNRKDIEEIEEEKNTLQKSQKILEAKSKLYDELSKNPNKGEGSSLFLVDFKNKEQIERDKNDEEEDDKIESDYDDDDDDWVDFVDCLGRTKRCHRDDLESMKSNDEILKKSLFGENLNRQEDQGRKEPEPKKDSSEAEGEPELCSEDMRREMLRKKWEEEERKLLDRKDIHYQHVLFDEARSHGVGYFNFSTDESERARQLEELNNLRKETIEKQAATQEAAARKKKQMEERLRAARRRKRERLGLPPEEEMPEESVEEEESKPEKPEELKREEQNPTTIRPWDLGKEKVSKILTQSEWIEKKREERPEEFAPPRFISTGEKFSQRKRRKPESQPKVFPEKESVFSTRDLSPTNLRGLGAEIPPSVNLEYQDSVGNKKINSSDIEKSIEEGLNFIRRKLEEKELQKEKGFIELL